MSYNNLKQKVAAYIRVSTDASDQENSYEMQERYFSRLLVQNPDWTAVGIYSDYGISGTDKQRRAGYRRLLRHCEEGKIDRIICKSISRFARNTSDFITALNILHENHVTILFEKENLDTSNPSSDFILTALGAIGQEESRSISENVRWSIRKRYPVGDVRNICLYGYRFVDGKAGIVATGSGYSYRAVEIVEEEAEVIRRIFREVADGISYRTIARNLNLDHIPAPVSPYQRQRRLGAGKGQLKEQLDEGWTAQSISGIIGLERYVGDVLLQKTYTSDYLTHKVRRNKGEVEQYLVRNHHPAIIDRKLFEEVQEVRKINAYQHGKNNGAGRRVRHSFSGRLICAHCGRYYNVRNTSSAPVWICPSSALNNGKKICCAPKIYEKQLIKMFRMAITDRYSIMIKAAEFVDQMRARLKNIQKMDHMERDCIFLRQKLVRLSEEPAQNEQQINIPKAERTEAKERAKRNQSEKRKLEGQLKALETYWMELEQDYEQRTMAILWMETLPQGIEGTTAFLDHVTDKYVGAFALSITVYSPSRYLIHWFDDTRTEVTLYADDES